jgi:8-oxo-dGTP diphosphatase
MPFTYEYPRPSVTVDCVVFGIGYPHPRVAPNLEVLLVQRDGEPFKGAWALPGGFVNVSDSDGQGESLDAAAHRELREETGIEVDYLEQLFTFGTPGRDPRGRVISVAYFALVRSKDHVATAGSDAAKAQWFSMTSALVTGMSSQLAFDHADILKMAVARLQAKVRYAPIGFNLLPPKFTLPELQAIYEAILGRPLDKRNFRRRVLELGVLAEAGTEADTPGKPGTAATLYRFDKRAYDKAVRDGFTFEL